MKLRFVIDKKFESRFLRTKDEKRALDSLHRSSEKFLQQTALLYQRSWDQINDVFSRYIERRTNYPWFYKRYTCVVSFVHLGIANWGTAPIIARGWKENPLTMRRITAHELIISHYFEIYKRQYKKEGLTDGQVWALAEIAAFALTSLTPDVKKFWPWDTRYYTTHNYPHFVPLQKKLKKPFLKQNFPNYIKTGIRLVRKYPKIHPEGAK